MGLTQLSQLIKKIEAGDASLEDKIAMLKELNFAADEVKFLLGLYLENFKKSS